jgi:tetratricopeptide (TPR) repeat protein
VIRNELSRPVLLIEQQRFDLAEKELRRRLTEDHGDASAHALLAFCLMKQQRLREAEQEARAAVGCAPDEGFSHFHLGQVLDERDRLNEAAASFQEAIRLDPEDADYAAALASVRVQQRRWKEALEAVELGLELDPDHAACTNLHAMILTQTGQTEEAHATLEDALARDPENAFTHANRGWTLLRESRPQEAIEHFREALRLAPSFEYARIGIVEAMKARNPVYRPVLRFFLWMGSLQGRNQVWLILGLFFGVRLLRQVGQKSPSLAPFITPVIWLYTLFVLMTWIADPLFNLLLRLDRFGRLALSREQIRASNWLGALLGVALLALIAGFATGSEILLLIGLGAGVLVFPTMSVFRCARGWPRWTMIVYSALLAAALSFLAFRWFVATASGRSEQAGDFAGAYITIAILGGALSTWLGSGLSFARSRHF